MAGDDDDEDLNLTEPWRPDGPTVIPAKALRVSIVRDRIDRQKGDKDAVRIDRPLFKLSRRVPFGPLIQKGFVQIQRFSGDDWKRLEDFAGAKIPEDCRDYVEEACGLFVNSVALQKQMASWKKLRELLETIVPAAKVLLKTLQDPQRCKPVIGALSPIQTIRTYISLELSGSLEPPDGLNRLIPDLSRVVRFGEVALLTAQKGPGTGVQAELRFFLYTLDDMATALGIPTKLLGHDVFVKVNRREGAEPVERTPPLFFRFVREVLRLANVYGEPGISTAALPQEEREAAIKTLEAYTKKTDKALSKQLERIRDDIRSAEAPAMVTSGTAT